MKSQLEFLFYWWKNRNKKIPVFNTHKEIVLNTIQGFSQEEIISKWLSTLPGIVVVLLDIDVAAKSKLFWDTVPYETKKEFIKDVVILNCRDISRMEQIIGSIDLTFATALGFKNGQLIRSNDYTRIK